MGFVIGIYQIVVVLINLDGSKLTLVNNVLVREGTEVEPIVQANGMGGTLAEHVELSFEIFIIKLLRIGIFRGIALSIGRSEDHEWLQNNGFTRSSSGAKES
jgi:hypothetical protein